jgi:serine/threonine-protein kinase
MGLEGASIGNYVVRSKLGEGGMGAVYLGEHPLIGKKVAVKVLKEELSSNAEVVRRFFNEAKAVNEIHHQNIVDIVDFGKMPSGNGGEIAYIIMEFLEGESLASRLRSTGLRVPEVVEVMQQACSALAASHNKGIIHRDLKPDNIYLCPRGPTRNFVKVLDFGIAKLTGGDGDHSQTRTGTVMGTPYYMSPEQCEGRRQIDHRSDVYSLGVVMYELLTGRVPFNEEGFGALIVAHLTKMPEPPCSVRPGVPAELDAVVMRALEKDPTRRFQTMDEFSAAIGDPAWFGAVQSRASAQMPTITANTGRGAALGSSGIRPVTTLSGAASEVSGPVPLVEPGKSRAGLFAVLGLLVVGGAGGAAWFLRGGAPSGATPAAQIGSPQAAQPAASQKIYISFVSTPSGARVVRPDGVVLGATPFKMEATRGGDDIDVSVVLDGYKQQQRRITPDDDK